MSADDLIGTYDEQAFAPARTAAVDTVRIGKQKHHIPVLLEVDVTAARAALAARNRDTAEELSFTAWATVCLARAVSEHKAVHALRRGRGGLVIFDQVDVSLAVFRRLADGSERLPMPTVVRRADQKTVTEVSAELRQAQTRSLAPGEQWLDPSGFAPPPRLLRLAFAAPFRLRKWLYWDRLLGDPFRVKRTMGTVMLTSVPLKTASKGGAWAIPVGIHPLVVALGAIGERTSAGTAPNAAAPTDAPPAAGAPQRRDVLSLTVLFDHDVTDGVPVALFLRRLTELMEGAFGL